MTWNGKPKGETGKGPKPRVGSDLSNLDNIDFSKPIKSCNSCDEFEGTVGGIMIKCQTLKKKGTRKFDTQPCEEWKNGK